MRSDREIHQVCELICRVLEGQAAADEVRRLEELLHSDPEVLGLYVQVADAHAELMCPGQSMAISYQADKDPELDMRLWQLLLNEEKTAPTLEIPEAVIERPLIAKVEPVRAERRINKFSLVSVITSAAALLFLVLFAQFGPSRSVSVATITDSFDAQWENASLETGSRLTNRPAPLRLRSGFAKLQFDNGAEVIVEGPCDFQLDSADEMQLHYGKLTAVVPPAAAGFRVDTSVMSVIDLGTEFSVWVDEQGVASVNLYEGRASVLAGKEGHRKGTHLLTAGQARRVSPQTHAIEEILLNEKDFVRRVDSQKGFVWQGEPVDLAGIVAGGDGFAAVRGIAGIDPQTGEAVRGYNYRLRQTPGGYQLVSGNPFVDGVFIPDGGEGDNVISSAGQVFADCPDTFGVNGKPVGVTSHDILTFCDYDEGKVAMKPNQLPIFDGIGMGTAKSPAILMHSNAGITFDLEAIRSRLSGVEIRQLTCSVGLPNREVLEYARADVWVLLDGQSRYVKRDLVPADGLISLAVDIASTERFLTIAVTDAAKDVPADQGIDNDYVYLIAPRLSLAGAHE